MQYSIVRFFLKIVFGLILCSGIFFGFISSKFGKAQVVHLLEKQIEKNTSVRLKVGNLRGNWLKRLAFYHVEIQTPQITRPLFVESISIDYRIKINWKHLFQSKVLIEKMRLNGGSFEYDQCHLNSIYLNLEFTEKQFSQLPLVMAAGVGRCQKLPLKFNARIQKRAPFDASVLSGIGKSRLPTNSLPDDQVITAGVSLGRSHIDLIGRGVFPLESLEKSHVQTQIRSLKLESRELKRLNPEFPIAFPFEAKGFFDLYRESNRWRFLGDLEAQFWNRLRLFISGKGSQWSEFAEIDLNSLKLFGKCQLLTLKKSARLYFSKKNWPQGSLAASGCGGEFFYQKQGSNVFIGLKKIDPARILESIPIVQNFPKQLGVWNFSVQLPKGEAVPEAMLVGNWELPNISSRGELRATLADSQLLAQMKASLFGQEVWLHSNLRNILKGQSWNPSLEKSSGNIELGAFSFDLSSLRRNLSGVADFSLKAEGDQNQVKVGLNAQIEKFLESPRSDLARVRENNVKLGVQGDSEFSFLRRKLKSKLFITSLNDKSRLLELRFDLNKREIDATVTTNDLNKSVPVGSSIVDSIINNSFSNLSVEGAKLRSDFHVTGSPQSLNYDGFFSLSANSVRVLELGTTYQNIDIDLKGARNRIEISNISVQSGPGKLQGSGIFNPNDSSSPIAFAGTFDRFQAISSDVLNLELSGQLRLALNRLVPQFSGDVNVREGTLRLLDTNKKKVESLSKLEDLVEIGAIKKQPLKTRYQGSVRFHAPGQLWIKSNDMSIETSAFLEVGQDQEFFLKGNALAKRGFVEFFGRTFEIANARADFLGNLENPRLEANAIYKAPLYDIDVLVRGPLQDLKPVLVSIPPGLSEEECIGVLLTGSPDYQRSGGGGSGVSGLASGYLMSQLKQKLGPKLPFDTLRADLRSQGDQSIEIGKYLTNRIFVKLGRAFVSEENQSINALTLDYRLSDKWSIETTQTDRGRSDLEVLWTLNY